MPTETFKVYTTAPDGTPKVFLVTGAPGTQAEAEAHIGALYPEYIIEKGKHDAIVDESRDSVGRGPAD